MKVSGVSDGMWVSLISVCVVLVLILSNWFDVMSCCVILCLMCCIRLWFYLSVNVLM